MRLSVGYNAIWISDVAFSGDQIDTTINPSQLSGGILIGPAQPAFAFHDTEYWLHGLTLGRDAHVLSDRRGKRVPTRSATSVA